MKLSEVLRIFLPALKKQEPQLYEKHKEFLAKLAKEHLVEMLAAGFVVQQVSWQGQTVVRGLPQTEYYLRLKSDGKMWSFLCGGNPLVDPHIPLFDEGKVDRKWFSYEGELAPQTEYNPNKKLKAEMTILDRGSISLKQSETEKGEIVLDVKFRGKKLRGDFKIIQEDKNTPNFVLSPA
ncbi:MAG: hypothetical protein ACXQTL_05965 [Methanosarcinales archaeon]